MARFLYFRLQENLHNEIFSDKKEWNLRVADFWFFEKGDYWIEAPREYSGDTIFEKHTNYLHREERIEPSVLKVKFGGMQITLSIRIDENKF